MTMNDMHQPTYTCRYAAVHPLPPPPPLKGGPATPLILVYLFYCAFCTLAFCTLAFCVCSLNDSLLDDAPMDVSGPGGYVAVDTVTSLDAFRELCLRERTALYLTAAGSARVQVEC